MLAYLNKWIDGTTMYRLVLYYLILLVLAAISLGAFGLIAYSPLTIIYSVVLLLASAWAGNKVFAWLFRAVTNHESALISAFILALIVDPVPVVDPQGSVTLVLIGLIAAASKYVLAYKRKHLFNPAALAVVVSAYALGTGASWWVGGNLPLLPFVLLGLAIVYKIRRLDLFFSFFFAALLLTALATRAPLSSALSLLLYSPMLYLGFVMLTEPLTTPPSRVSRIAYGAIVGALFVPVLHVGDFYFTPELALFAGNLFAFFVSAKGTHTLALREKRERAKGIYEFIFQPEERFAFRPGQYLEWTLAGVPVDSRGNRRYFTIASAPGEEAVALGTRFAEAPSAFKRRLATLSPGDTLQAASLAGDFTLPEDRNKKLAFLAGGIGVTPFVSMARHMLRAGERREAVLVYSARSEAEFAYKEVFAEAAPRGLRAVYVNSSQMQIDADLIRRELPDYRERLFYISGSHGFVDAMKRLLKGLGVRAIKTDYFPGLA